jgi:2-oxoglutarate dehydrogenase E2 component (dihydrolipoamide succinyltransferase)
VSWHKKEGDFVTRDENLIDIETDKVVLETPAPESGQLKSIKKPNGASVASNELIAVIDTDAKPAAGASVVAAPDVSSAKPAPAAPAAIAAAPAVAGTASTAATATKAAIAMPAARKMMADQGVDAGTVEGTGRGGRVTKGDVIAALEAGPAVSMPAPAAPARSAPPTAPAAAAPPAPMVRLAANLMGRPEQRVPMSRLRQRVAERLVQSQSTAAILTTFNEVNMQPIIDLRNRYKDRFEKEHGVKLGFMSFFVKAAVHALKKYPVVNASIDGADIVYHGYFDIGIAVGSPRGLVVPILRDADQKSLAGIEKDIADFGKRAGEGKLTIEELTGGTFSISNGGVFGSMLSTPIINPPQSAILGVHATKERPVAENGQVVIRPINYLALSYDHRIIDGREAVLSLVAMKEALEDPARMLLDL